MNETNSMATIEHSAESDELMRLRRLVRALQGALGTEEDGSALVEVARNCHTAELQAAKETVIDDFCDAVLAKLKLLGVPETDNCDGDEDVSTIFAGWIDSRIRDARDKCHDSLAILSNGLTGAELERDRLGAALEEVAHTTALWDAHAIAHRALKSDSPAGRAAADGSADETGESKSGAGSASRNLSKDERRIEELKRRITEMRSELPKEKKEENTENERTRP